MATERPRFDLFSPQEKEPKENELYDVALDVYRIWHAVLGEHRDIIDFDLREGPESGESLASRMIIGSPNPKERKMHVYVLSRLLE